ncbi:hypothetical protein Y886_22400 [Xanthomonas hyacinthi DSM 19077]|nr:hypothetical protein Y886_22400 [Xanthomonas hyacinthi DSM 19077]
MDSDHAPPLSTELAAMLSESENTTMAQSRCLQCVHSTCLTLAFPVAEGEPPNQSELVVYCGAMNRDITVPVVRCSSFEPKPLIQ